MPRRQSDTKSFKVTLTRGQAYFLEELAKIGLHGATPSQVIQTLASERLAQLVINDGVFKEPLMRAHSSASKQKT